MSREVDRRSALRLGALNTLRGGFVLNTNVYRVKAGTVGTVTLENLTITSSTAANSAQFISDLVVKDVTVGGVAVTP